MTTRVLPPEEWHRLAHTPTATFLAAVNPDHVHVLVVEDDQGDVVGCWVLISMLHAEGVWVADGQRHRGAVQRRLLRGMRELVTSLGAHAVMTGAETPEVAEYLERLGGARFPPMSYLLPMEK